MQQGKRWLISSVYFFPFFFHISFRSTLVRLRHHHPILFRWPIWLQQQFCNNKQRKNENCTLTFIVFPSFNIAGWRPYSLLLHYDLNWARRFSLEATANAENGFVRGVASYHVSIGAVFDLLFFQNKWDFILISFIQARVWNSVSSIFFI